MQSKHYICERCGKTAVICHHKRYISPKNINNPEITLNWSNLEALCLDCHNKEHFKTSGTVDGLTFDDDGNLVKITPTQSFRQAIGGIGTGDFSFPLYEFFY